MVLAGFLPDDEYPPRLFQVKHWWLLVTGAREVCRLLLAIPHQVDHWAFDGKTAYPELPEEDFTSMCMTSLSDSNKAQWA
jgi:hypothetical protein